MVRGKLKKSRLSPEQSFTLEEESNSEQELMELYEEQTKENLSENMESENLDSLTTMLEVEDIRDATAQLEEYSQMYNQEDEMAQCVPELVVCTPTETIPKITNEKKRPRMKFTAKRRSPEKTPRRKLKQPKKSPCVDSTSSLNTGSQSEDEFPKAKKEGTWIQCSKTDCLKWRKLPNDIEPSAMPDRWVCAMNPDITRTECTASQETCDSELEFDVVYTPFVAGSLVWAKVPGYPWWPGMIEDDPDYNCCYETDESNVNPISYHVSFIFDKDVSRSWVSHLGIQNFDATHNPNEIGPKQKKYTKPLARALAQAKNAMDLTLLERINKYSFNVLYKGQARPENDERPRKMKKRKQAKTSSELCKPKKMKTVKAEKKMKRPSLTDGEKSNESSQSEVKKKVKKRKRILPSSDEEDHGKDITNDVSITNDINTTLAENSDNQEDVGDNAEETKHSPQLQQPTDERSMEREITKDEESSEGVQNDKTDIKDEGGKKEKSKLKCAKKNKPSKTKNEAPKKRRKNTTCDEERKTTQSKSPDHLKVKKKKLKKSEEKPTGKTESLKSKKKSKFINPVTTKSTSVLSTSNVSENSVDDNNKDSNSFTKRFLHELTKDTSTDSSIDGGLQDNDRSIDLLAGEDTSTNEDISHTEEPNQTLNESEKQTPVKETGKITGSKKSNDNKKPSFKAKKKKPTKDSPDDKVSVVKPKKFELVLGIGKKSKPKHDETVKKIKKTSSLKTTAGGTMQQECASEIALEGTSVKPKNTKINKSKDHEQKIKSTSKVKKMKQTLGKFKAPMKTNSKVTPATKATSLKTHQDEKSKEEAKKTLEEVLEIPSSDDPRKNPEKYVSIDLLEKDISDLYQELSDNAAASTGVTNAKSIEDDLTEASDCVTMEFLDQEISGNIESSEKISTKRLTDSPEF